MLRGAVAQLGERRVRIAKVGSSSLLRSTNMSDNALVSFVLTVSESLCCG